MTDKKVSKSPFSSKYISLGILLFLVFYQELFEAPYFIQIHQALLLILLLVLDIIQAFCAFLLWINIFVRKHYANLLYLLIPIILDFLYVLLSPKFHQFDGYEQYKQIATYFITITHFRLDLFYLDYAGFAIFYVIFFDTIITIIIFAILNIASRKKSGTPIKKRYIL